MSQKLSQNVPNATLPPFLPACFLLEGEKDKEKYISGHFVIHA